MSKLGSRISTAVAAAAVGGLVAGGVMLGVNAHNAQVVQEQHAAAVALMMSIESATPDISGAAADQAATLQGDQEAAAVAKARAEAAAQAQLAAQQAAAQRAAQLTKTTTTKTYAATKTATAQAPVRCPAGSTANSSDGTNDTSCLPNICFTIALPSPTHPECNAPFKP